MAKIRSPKSALKHLLLTPPVSGLVEPMEEAALRSVYFARFSRWVREQQGKAGFDDFGSDDYAYEKRFRLYEFLLGAERLSEEPLDYLEFGVHQGASITWWAQRIRHPDSRFVGFDTFTGLPEHWHGQRPQGFFSTEGEPPRVEDSRVSFQKGLFQDTMHPFLAGRALARRLMVHLDADLYSSTLFVLTTLAPKLKRGDLLLFDEFSDVLHEFRAYLDFLSAFPLRCELVGAVNAYRQVAFRVL